MLKKKTENDLELSKKTVGWYIYDSILQKPSQKIRGKLIRTIERKYYKTELRAILEKQSEYHPELNDSELYARCVKELYAKNEAHKKSISARDFSYLFLEDIIFYQRPLKSKKSLISNCPYEDRLYKDKVTNEKIRVPVKCIPKSHPLFQEFRLWQFIANLRILQKDKIIDGRLKADVDVTNEYLKEDSDYVALFEWLNNRKEVDQKAFLKYPGFNFKKQFENFRWNYVEDKPYPCNKTRNAILTKLEKTEHPYLTQELEIKIWHLLYSVKSKEEIDKALSNNSYREDKKDNETKFQIIQELRNNSLSNDSIERLKKVKIEETDYGSYSAKAISKLLLLMRRGKYWSEQSITDDIKKRINSIIERLTAISYSPEQIDEVKDDDIPKQVLKSFVKCADPFKGLNTYQACYALYGRHSEAKDISFWRNPGDMDTYLRSFRQHSLRNPIVEQVITETLRVVRDIWVNYGEISEIHLELGREMKNPADKRKKMTEQISENENANLRIKALLIEFINPEFEVEGVRPYSPSQQEILRIFEDGVLNSGIEIPEDVENILKKFRETDTSKQPTSSDVKRYKLWLEQKYKSPYTGRIIPLGKLFTSAYQIEHIIPQSRYFDDSFSNKVICEAEINQLKGNQLGYEFIKNHHGEKVELSFNETVEVLSVEGYEKFVKNHYSKNRGKMKKLLMEEIPDGFIERQLNDTRYISKLVKGLLSNIVREDGEEEPTSKNLITCTGNITEILKKDWGLNDVWNTLIYPRFERLNELTSSSRFGQWENKDGKRFFQINVPFEYQKGFSKKRIDHRHHAMDALVIACATRNHVNYLNNESAKANAKETRYDLRRNLRRIETAKVERIVNGEKVLKIIETAKEFHKPWETFAQDALKALENVVVSFKQNLRVVNKANNRSQIFDVNNRRILINQNSVDNWAIRKPLHKDTVFGLVNIRKIKTVNLSAAINQPSSIVHKPLKNKVLKLLASGTDKKGIVKYFKEHEEEWNLTNLSKIEVYYFTKDSNEKLVATRKPLNVSFNFKRITESVTDVGIQKILLRHLENSGNNPEVAFSPDGIDEMNKNIIELNNNKPHLPIYKVRIYEPLGNKFVVGVSGNKNSKFVEAAKGTNLFFAVYQTDEGKRVFETIPLNLAVERQKQGLSSAPEVNEDGASLLFCLSPNDLVYLPNPEELTGILQIDKLDKGRIYKMVSCTGYVVDFIPSFVASPIVQNVELGSNNKAQRAWTDEMIKDICVLIKVDRLGKIISIYR